MVTGVLFCNCVLHMCVSSACLLHWQIVISYNYSAPNRSGQLLIPVMSLQEGIGPVCGHICFGSSKHTVWIDHRPQ